MTLKEFKQKILELPSDLDDSDVEYESDMDGYNDVRSIDIEPVMENYFTHQWWVGQKQRDSGRKRIVIS